MNIIPGAFTKVANLYHDNVAVMALELEKVAGFATLSFGPLPKGGATPTGIPNAAGPYTATAKIDGSDRAISVAGTAAQTFTDLVTELNTDLSTWATVTLVGGDIVITSKATGETSTVVVTDTDLFSRVNGTDYGWKSNRSVKGHTKYLDWNKMAAAEQAELLTIMNAVDTTETNWGFANDKVTVTGTGVTPLSAMGIAAGTYALKVTVNTVDKEVQFAVTAGMNFQQMMDDAFLPALQAQWPALTAYLVPGTDTMDIVVATTVPGNVAAAAPTVAEGTAGGGVLAFIGAVDGTAAWACAVGDPTSGVDGTSTLDVDGTADSGYQIVDIGDGVAGGDATGLANDPTVYTAAVVVDGGTSQPISIVGSAAQTYTLLLAELNADTTGATWSLNGDGNLQCTSDTTGLTSTVAITNTDLFDTLTTWVGLVTAVPGTTGGSWQARIDAVKSLNGFPLLGQVGTVPLFERENKPSAKGRSFVDGAYKYYDGTNWKVYDTDVVIV